MPEGWGILLSTWRPGGQVLWKGVGVCSAEAQTQAPPGATRSPRASPLRFPRASSSSRVLTPCSFVLPCLLPKRPRPTRMGEYGRGR